MTLFSAEWQVSPSYRGVPGGDGGGHRGGHTLI